jgi:uncharacterized protein HemX
LRAKPSNTCCKQAQAAGVRLIEADIGGAACQPPQKTDELIQPAAGNRQRKERGITMFRINSFKTNKTMIWLLSSAVSLTLAASLPIWGLARDAKQDHSGHAMGQEMKAPQTAREHREHAEQYQKKAAEYRKEAEAHRKMLADYSKTVARNPKDTNENAYVKKMRRHCQKYSNAAEALAQEADEMAKFHTMRAKETEGK